MQALVEPGDGEPVDEFERVDVSSIGPNHEAVVDEVKVDGECGSVLRVHATRG
jgi:hypothetical protein